MNGSVTYEGLILQGGINVDTGANLEELTVYENGVYNPPTGKDGFSKVTVDVPAAVLDNITINENGHYTPPIGVDGYDDITVSVPHPAPVLDDITITANGTYQPPSGVDGYNEITVNVPLPSNGIYKQTLTGLPSHIATFTGADAPIDELIVSIDAVQSGSGDPSPSNIRPISGWTTCEVTVTDDLTTPTYTHTYTIPFTDSQGQSVEVFGGSVNVNEGKVLVTHFRNKITSVTRSTSTTFFRNTTTAKGSQYGSRVKCDKFVSANTGNDVGVFVNNKGAVRFNTEKEYASASEFLEDYGGEINVVYERETPSELTFNPTSIKSHGVTNISVNCGEVTELKYFSDIP